MTIATGQCRKPCEIAEEIRSGLAAEINRIAPEITDLDLRLQALKQRESECEWIIKLVHLIRKRSTSTEWIEGKLELFQDVACLPPTSSGGEFFSPPETFRKLAELCESTLVERTEQEGV